MEPEIEVTLEWDVVEISEVGDCTGMGDAYGGTIVATVIIVIVIDIIGIVEGELLARFVVPSDNLIFF